MPIIGQDLAIEAAEAGAAVVRYHYGSSLTRFQKSGDDAGRRAAYVTDGNLTSRRMPPY